MDYVDLYDVEKQEISGVDYSDKVFTDGCVEACVFRNCIFTNTKFLNCRIEGSEFIGCSFINPDFTNSRLIDIVFIECKIVGLVLFKCSQASFDLVFTSCVLSYCNFTDVSMKKNLFHECTLRESYFQNTFLVEAKFTDCSFESSVFNNCDLRKSSFVNSDGYCIDPRDSRIEKAHFSVPGVLGLLAPFDIEIV